MDLELTVRFRSALEVVLGVWQLIFTFKLLYTISSRDEFIEYICIITIGQHRYICRSLEQ
jgi:hypothetical protein